MRELWETFVAWWNESGVSILTQLVVYASMITSVVVAIKNVKKTTKSELKALAENYQMSKEQHETNENIGTLKGQVEELNDIVNKLVGLNVILLKNSKISFDDKEKAMELVKASGVKAKAIVEKTKDITEIVEEIVDNANETIEQAQTEGLTGNEFIDKLKPLLENE